MKLFAVLLLLLGVNGQLQAAIEAVYEGNNGIRSKVLTVCMQCHSTTLSGGSRNGAPSPPNFNTYADAILLGDFAVARAVEGSMPPQGLPRLTAEQKSALLAWQAAGFPERSASVADTQAPTTPSGLTATTIGASRIDLAWTASSDNVGVTAYKVYRGDTLIATLGNVTGHSDTALNPSTAYTYNVTACDTAGNCSALSASATATTPNPLDTQAPTAPSGLTATTISTSQINLAWTVSVDNVGVTAYKVYRGDTLIATLDTTTSYSDKGLSASTTYSYGVAACDAAGNCSAPSASALATTQQQPDCLYNWAEVNFPGLFAPPTLSLTAEPYYYRYYSQTNAYLAIAAGRLYYLGPVSANAILDLGDVLSWYATSGCQ